VPRRRTHDDALRLRLLDRAAQLVAENGPDQLGLRELAADAHTSTTAVYSLFGGKDALLSALADTAAARFTERLSAAPSDDLVALGLAYRDAALAQPHLYSLMATPGLDAMRGAAGDDLGRALWSTVHGLVSLELAGGLPGGEFERAVRALLAGWPG
jgi:AcrR family transcriptional regulator